jgi:hypothetical protein
MGYMEEVFQRAEKLFTSDSAKLSWLSSFERPERGATEYTKDALKVRDEFISAEALNRDYKKTSNILELKEMKQEADSLRFYGKDVSSDIQFKINSLQEIKIKEEREKEIEVQKQLERDKERKQELKQKYKEAETFEEQREARRELKKVFPQVYGGIKGSERRKGRGLALRYITGEIE